MNVTNLQPTTHYLVANLEICQQHVTTQPRMHLMLRHYPRGTGDAVDPLHIADRIPLPREDQRRKVNPDTCGYVHLHGIIQKGSDRLRSRRASTHFLELAAALFHRFFPHIDHNTSPFMPFPPFQDPLPKDHGRQTLQMKVLFLASHVRSVIGVGCARQLHLFQKERLSLPPLHLSFTIISQRS